MAAEPDPVGLRIGDAERERAADALGAHFRAGRLDPTEYDERVQAAFGARTAAELTPLFADLPHGSALAPAPPPARPAARSRAVRRPGHGLPRAVAVLLVVAAVIGFTAVAHFPPFFLIPLLWFGFGRRFTRIPQHNHGYGYGGPRGRRY